jgi:ABC-2 type transport system permease protein
VLTGAAVIREREHGTLEHLLVMPLTAFEIAMAKVWANSLVILVARAPRCSCSFRWSSRCRSPDRSALVRRGRAVSVLRDGAGDLPGDDLAFMAQFALLIILVIMVLMLLSGGSTPVESQPRWLQVLTFLLPPGTSSASRR